MTPHTLLASSPQQLEPKTTTGIDGKGYSILYIGNDPGKKLTSVDFQKRQWASSFISAKRQLKICVKGHMKLPDLIIIDQTFNEQSLNEFIGFLKRTRCTKYIPVIYNEQALNLSQIKKIKRLQLADDIVDIITYEKDLQQKAIFLHKSKILLSEKDCYQSNSTKNFIEINCQLFQLITRRFLEISIACILLMLLSPLIFIIMISIKVESRGPVIYRSKRAGKGCRIFDFYKFRTMNVDADADIFSMQAYNIYPAKRNSPLFFKALNDPRITRVGMFLRNTSLDELPQLINVIKGDMSLVGNRPLPLYEASTLTNDQWAERFLAPAGITGLWQVLNRGKNNMSAEERLKLDINYARNNSFIRDCWIVANTPKALFQKFNM